MGRQSSQNELHLLSLDFGGNGYGVSQLAENHPYQHYFLADGSDGPHCVSPPFPQWIQCRQNTPKYVEFLAENGASELQGDASHSNISGMTSNFQHTISLFDMDVKQAIHPRLQYESSINNFGTAEHQICVQVIVMLLNHIPHKPRRRVSRERASASDRLRRLRIAEGINALQELLPQSKEDLSQNRLGGESTSNFFISLEGYGHYLHYKQMLKQPLEEMMGKLMKMNPLAADELLKSRGLFIMPMAIGEALHYTT